MSILLAGTLACTGSPANPTQGALAQNVQAGSADRVGDGNTPAQLTQHGWTCENVPGHGVHFGYALVRSSDAGWAEALRREWRANVKGFTPRERSLDWRFMRTLTPEEMGRTYAWYQQVLNLHVADVYAQHGLGFLRAARTGLPWARLDDWTTPGLVTALEAIAPGFQAWADGFKV